MVLRGHIQKQACKLLERDGEEKYQTARKTASPLFFNRRRLAIKQAANLIWFPISHPCYVLADMFCEFQGTDKALCCDLEELSSCCDFFQQSYSYCVIIVWLPQGSATMMSEDIIWIDSSS